MGAVHLSVGCQPNLHLLSQEEQERIHHDVTFEQVQDGERAFHTLITLVYYSSVYGNVT